MNDMIEDVDPELEASVRESLQLRASVVDGLTVPDAAPFRTRPTSRAGVGVRAAIVIAAAALLVAGAAGVWWVAARPDGRVVVPANHGASTSTIPAPMTGYVVDGWQQRFSEVSLASYWGTASEFHMLRVVLARDGVPAVFAEMYNGPELPTSATVTDEPLFPVDVDGRVGVAWSDGRRHHLVARVSAGRTISLQGNVTEEELEALVPAFVAEPAALRTDRLPAGWSRYDDADGLMPIGAGDTPSTSRLGGFGGVSSSSDVEPYLTWLEVADADVAIRQLDAMWTATDRVDLSEQPGIVLDTSGPFGERGQVIVWPVAHRELAVLALGRVDTPALIATARAVRPADAAEWAEVRARAEARNQRLMPTGESPRVTELASGRRDGADWTITRQEGGFPLLVAVRTRQRDGTDRIEATVAIVDEPAAAVTRQARQGSLAVSARLVETPLTDVTWTIGDVAIHPFVAMVPGGRAVVIAISSAPDTPGPESGSTINGRAPDGSMVTVTG